MTEYIGILAAALLALTGACAPGLRDGGSSPSSEQADERGDAALFVANKQENSVSRIDLASGLETARVPSCINPHELALSPDGEHVALGCYGGTALEIFRADDLARVTAIELGDEARPHGLIWHANGQLMAGAEGRGTVFVVEEPLSAEPELVEIDAVEGGPHLIAVSADGGIVWGTAVRLGEVVRIDVASRNVTHRNRLGGDTEAIALSPDGSALWVGANSADRLYRLNPATLEVESEIDTGAMPIRVAASPDGRHAVTSNLRDGSLSVVDAATNRVARTIEVAGSPRSGQVTITFSPDGERLYVAETGANMVAEIEFATGEVLRRLAAGEGGDGLAISR